MNILEKSMPLFVSLAVAQPDWGERNYCNSSSLGPFGTGTLFSHGSGYTCTQAVVIHSSTHNPKPLKRNVYYDVFEKTCTTLFFFFFFFLLLLSLFSILGLERPPTQFCIKVLAALRSQLLPQAPILCFLCNYPLDLKIDPVNTWRQPTVTST